MALNAKTLTIATAASASYTLPTNPTKLYALKNTGSNVIWLLHANSGTAAAEADECEAIPAGAVIYTQGYTAYAGGPKIIIAIAASADTKLNVAADMERY